MQFRMRVHNAEPYIYNRIDCSFTIANKYGYFVNRSFFLIEYTYEQNLSKNVSGK